MQADLTAMKKKDFKDFLTSITPLEVLGDERD